MKNETKKWVLMITGIVVAGAGIYLAVRYYLLWASYSSIVSPTQASTVIATAIVNAPTTITQDDVTANANAAGGTSGAPGKNDDTGVTVTWNGNVYTLDTTTNNYEADNGDGSYVDSNGNVFDANNNQIGTLTGQ